MARSQMRARNLGLRRPMRRRRRRVPRPMTVTKVRKIIGAELKHTTQNLSDDIPAAMGRIENISTDIIIGDLAQNRNGNWIQPIVYHGHIQINGFPAGTDPISLVRLAVFRWREDFSTAPPTALDLLESTNDVFGPFKYASRGKFDILWSRALSLVNNSDNSQFNKQFRFYIKLGRGQKCVYDNNTPAKYQLFFFLFTLSAIGEEPAYQLNSTLRFTDS